MLVGELEPTQSRSNVAVLEIGAQLLDLLNRIEVEVEGGVVLVEVPDLASRCQVHLAAGEFLVTVDEFQQRGFALTVPSNDADAVSLSNLQRLVVEYLSVKPVKRFGAAFHGQHVHATFIGRFQGKDEGFALLGHASLERLQFLLHALDHLVFGRDGLVVFVGPLHLRHGAHRRLDFFLDVGDGVAKRRFARCLLDEELGVVSLPRPRPKVVNLNDTVADLVEEVAVVRDDELGPFEFGQEGLEPLRGVNVEVVCGFVKENDVDAVEADELPRKRQFCLLAAREVVDGHVHRVLVKPEPLENALGDAGDVAPTA